jgi:hypothetical protein
MPITVRIVHTARICVEETDPEDEEHGEMRHRGVRGLVAGEETGKPYEGRREEEKECNTAEDNCERMRPMACFMRRPV